MAVYKYTLNKYFRSWSTWVIIGFSFFFTFFLGGWLPFHYFSPNVASASTDYISLSVGLVAGVTSFLSVFTSIFAGFKSAQMFKDEVEDGTFLLLLSKPIPRGQIIFQKWLALQSIMLVFTFVTALTFMFGMICFDEGYKVPELAAFGATTLRGHSIVIGLIMWSILTLFGLIFSSIALLVSTKFSTGTTIGLSIAIGVIIPMTSLISAFTKKNEVFSANNKQLESVNSQIDTLDLVYGENKNKLQDILDGMISKVPALDAYIKEMELPQPKVKIDYPDMSSSPVTTNTVVDAVSQIQLPDLSDLGDVDTFWNYLKKSFDEYYNFAENDKEGLFNIGIDSGKEDAYDTAWVGDLNFQVQQIASIASDISIPSQAQGVAEDSFEGTLLSSTHYVKLGELSQYTGHANDVDSKYIDDLIRKNSEHIESFRTGTHLLLLLTNDYLVSNLSDENKEKIANPPTGKDYYYGISKSLFDDINNYIFPTNSKENEWSAKARLDADHDKGYHITLQEMVELMNQLFVVEVNYALNPNNTVSGGRTYGALTNEMYDNWNLYKDLSYSKTHIDKTKNNPELIVDDETVRFQKQSYLIPEIGKMLGTSYRDSFLGFCSKNTISEIGDPKFVYYKTLLDYNKRATTPLSDLVINTGTLLDKARYMKIPIEKINGFDTDNGNREQEYDTMFNPLNLYGDELNTYSALVALDKENLLVKIDRKPYVNKYALLGFYLGLALLLVPVSYLLIRKQDYR